MVFSSNAFIFFFLPITLGLYFASLRLKNARKASNIVLTIMSLLFYAWGEPKFVFVMLASVAINWLVALAINKYKVENKPSRAKAVLTAGVIINVLLLGVFKYAGFAVRNFNLIFNTDAAVPQIALPIGISFFTFQAMSYIIDVYRGKGTTQKRFGGVFLYLAFFPLLIA